MPHRTPDAFRCKQLAVLVALVVYSLAAVARSQPLAAPERTAVQQFLAEQTAGLPGKVSIELDDPASAPPPCAAPQPFLPAGVKAWGRFSVGLSCAGERPWTRYLSARVAVQSTYLAATRALRPGETLQRQDVELRSGDLTTLPRTVLTDLTQIAGMAAANPIAAGAPMRADLLHGVILVHQGQTVRLQSEGPGFVVSTQAQALTNGAAGAPVQVKTAQGRILSGTARADGSVVVAR